MTNPDKIKAIVIGASAGAVEALSMILPRLPDDYPLPIMIVVHVPPDKKSVMAGLFQSKCKISIKEAEDKEEIQPGIVYFAPPDYHLLVEKDKKLSLSSEEQVNYSRPSIDVLFETAADAYASGLLGIVLTGANHDGASGLRAIIDLGGRAIIQRPDGAYAAAMPQGAIAICPEGQVMTLEEISDALQKGIFL